MSRVFRFARLGSIATATTATVWWVALPAGSRPPLPTDHPTHGVYDVAIVGGGILGLTIAREILLKHKGKLSVCVLEKESSVAPHQSSHNSGVIHAGIYDPETSLKTKLCVRGNELMFAYCKQNHLPVERIGKLIVATDDTQIPKVQALFEQAKKNGVKGVELLDAKQIKKLEPNVEGVMALHSPNTGICDFAAVTRHVATAMSTLFPPTKFGLHVNFMCEDFFSAEVQGKRGVWIAGREMRQSGPAKTVFARNVITCAGLHMDDVSVAAGGEKNPKVVSFRGRYYETTQEKQSLVTRNIYPVPGGGGIPVGIHFTPTVSEQRGRQMIVGPGAALATSKEGYRASDFSASDVFSAISNQGVWNFVVKNFGTSITTFKEDLSSEAFYAAAKKLVPSLEREDIVPSFVGVMGQVFAPDGTAMKDFVFEFTAPRSAQEKSPPSVLNIRNAPSPAATSSFAIAEHVVALAAKEFGW